MRYLAWGEIRRRWRGAVAVGLVLGIGFAAVLTAAAGARRTETAFPRMVAATGGTGLLVSSADEDQSSRLGFYKRVATLDGVSRVGLGAGVGLIPMRVPKGAGTVIEACSTLPLDGVFGYHLDRPNVLEGRLPRRDRSDEILVTDNYADTFGVGIGDELDLVVYSGDVELAAGEVTAADGPVAHATIVGIGVGAAEVVPLSDLDASPRIVASPAFVERYAPDQNDWCYDGALVALAPGADADRIVADIARMGEGSAFVQDVSANYDDVRRAIQPQVSALWLFAAVVAGATLLVVAQVLGRQLRQTAATLTPAWQAVGVTRSQRRMLVAAPSVVTALVGGLVAASAAVALSSRFPIGPARRAEIDRGTALHAWIHLGGVVLVVAVVVVVVAGAASFVAVQRRARPARHGWVSRVGVVGSQPAVVVGVQLATGSARGEAAVPVRSAAAGAALALGAVVATVTFASGLDDLVSQPARYGRDWDVMLDGGFGPTPVAKVVEELGDDPAVAAIASGRYGEVTIDGTRVPTVGLTDLVGSTFPAIIDGRAPGRDDEIVLGKRSLRDLHRSVGDIVAVDTGIGPREMTIVGTAAFPRLNHGSFSTLGLGVGAMARTEAFPPYELEGEFPPGVNPGDFVGPDGAMFEFVTIRVRSGATPDARREVIATATDIGITNPIRQAIRTEQRPIAIDNYAAIRSTPVVLAVLLGSMAAATLAHLVASVVRRRRRDLALCAALGMRRAQLLRAVVIQAVLVASVALVIGLPLGVAAGRIAWSGFASDLGVVDTLRLPLGAIGLAVLVVESIAIAVAVVPAFMASRIRPALILRIE